MRLIAGSGVSPNNGTDVYELGIFTGIVLPETGAHA